MPAIISTIGLLTISNIFMTFAWYAHLKEMSAKPWIIAALASWGIALFEYLFQVPANRIGYTVLGLGQLKMLQEIISISVLRAICVSLYEGTAEARLPVGRTLHPRRNLFCFPKQVARRVRQQPDRD
ncbi:MAG: DMT family protein [Woeseiaceae bacterium]|nr:DMT family protein [Woeseiaceae bacterium]